MDRIPQIRSLAASLSTLERAIDLRDEVFVFFHFACRGSECIGISLQAIVCFFDVLLCLSELISEHIVESLKLVLVHIIEHVALIVDQIVAGIAEDRARKIGEIVQIIEKALAASFSSLLYELVYAVDLLPDISALLGSGAGSGISKPAPPL